MTPDAKQCPQCGENILAIAKKCKHCQSILTETGPEARAISVSDYGVALLAIPIVGAALAYFWIGGMNFLQSPESSLALVVLGTVCSTAILAAVEASKAGSVYCRAKGTYSPLQWFFLVALLWVVGYPAYLLKRKKYGLKNYLWAGLAVMLAFCGTVTLVTWAMESQLSELRGSFGQLQSEIRSLQGKSGIAPSDNVTDVLQEAEIQARVTDALAQAGGTKAAVAEHYANTGEMPASCATLGGCPTSVIVKTGGSVVIDLSSADRKQVSGKVFVLDPVVSSNGDVAWKCASNADPRYVPQVCRNPISNGALSEANHASEVSTVPTVTDGLAKQVEPVGANLTTATVIGTYRSAKDGVLIIGAVEGSQTRWAFQLNVGVNDGQTSCQEGYVDCLAIEGVASLTKPGYLQSEGSECNVRIKPQGDIVEVEDISGDCGAGTGNRAQTYYGVGKYLRAAPK